jgi:heat-inducible transcriptional repressor
MMDDRKAAILRAVVEEYIDTAQPVGSGLVARTAGVDVSAATIRNEMAALEREGYLAQPHTSAGRVPTEKGYRFFVDTLDASQHLDASRRQQVKSFFGRAHGEIEHVLAETSRLLSDLTANTGVVVLTTPDPGTVRSVQLVSLAPRVALLVIVSSNGVVEKRTLELAAEVGEERVVAASTHLNAALVGRSRDTGVPSAGDQVVDDLVAVALAALHSGGDDEVGEQVYVGGAARMADAFDAVQTVRRVLELLEHHLVVVSLLRDVIDRGLSVAIGTETGLEPLSECAVVVAPYEVDGEHAGTIGILGPTRMNYPQALATVATVSRRLGDRLREG